MKKTEFPQNWTERVGLFADAVGKPLEEVTKLLAPVVGEPGDEALQILADVGAVPDGDIKAALATLNIPSGKMNLHLIKLRGEQKSKESEAAKSNFAGHALAILPAVPDDESFLVMLKTGGVLKVETTEVLSAVKAALAKRIGLFDLPEMITEKMEDFATKQENPCGEDFYKLQKLLAEKKYGDILSSLGISGTYVTEKRKKEFFARLEERLWPALSSFHTQLNAWQQAWMNGAANPAMMMMAMTASQTGGAMPAGIMAPPDTTTLRATGEEVINEINRIFAGTGIPVARALGYDATRIMGILNNSALPAQIGVATKEQMLKELGINVGADLVRTEQSVTRYTLAIMSLPKVTADAEVPYLAALIQLGANIPWDKLVKGAGLGRKL